MAFEISAIDAPKAAGYKKMTVFVPDEVIEIAKKSISETLKEATYNRLFVAQWSTVIVDQCLSQLVKIPKSYRYIVNCLITKCNGTGLHSASLCYWDETNDGCCTIKYTNNDILCLVYIYGIA